jgi:hypothetical protein
MTMTDPDVEAAYAERDPDVDAAFKEQRATVARQRFKSMTHPRHRSVHDYAWLSIPVAIVAAFFIIVFVTSLTPWFHDHPYRWLAVHFGFAAELFRGLAWWPFWVLEWLIAVFICIATMFEAASHFTDRLNQPEGERRGLGSAVLGAALVVILGSLLAAAILGLPGGKAVDLDRHQHDVSAPPKCSAGQVYSLTRLHCVNKPAALAKAEASALAAQKAATAAKADAARVARLARQGSATAAQAREAKRLAARSQRNANAASAAAVRTANRLHVTTSSAGGASASPTTKVTHEPVQRNCPAGTTPNAKAANGCQPAGQSSGNVH